MSSGQLLFPRHCPMMPTRRGQQVTRARSWPRRAVHLSARQEPPQARRRSQPRSTPHRAWGKGETLGFRATDSTPASDAEEPPAVPGHRDQPDVGEAPMESPSRSRSTHSWGRGQRLAATGSSGHPDEEEEEEEAEEPGGDIEEEDAEELLPQHLLIPPAFDPEIIFRQNGNRIRSGFEPRYQWPDQGNRLREELAAEETRKQQDLPSVLAQAALDRLNRAAESPPRLTPLSAQKKLCRATPVPSLFNLATGSAVTLMAAPSMQYSRSLACLTPELAEHLLLYVINQRLLRPKSFEIFFGCQIQRLVLDCYPYATNDLLRQLRAFHSLRHLSLSSCSLVTDSGLEVLSSLHRLQHLNLAACVKLTNNCLCSIKGLNCLSHLILDQTKVSDSGMMEYLAVAPATLVHLSLNQTAISDRVLSALPSAVPQLRLLSIKHTKVYDVSALKDLLSLQTLHLDNTCVTESSLRTLGSHSTLSSLSLCGLHSPSGDVTLQIISGLKLTHLKLPDRHSVSDSGLCFLSLLERLTELDLTDYTQVTDEGVSHLARLLRLTKLSLSNTLVTDAGLVHLQPLKYLEELCLDRTNVGSKAVAQCIRTLPHLQVLGLASTRVGDSVVAQGLLLCTQLLKVNLSRTRITDRGLRYLSQTKVVQVNLDGTGVTVHGVSGLMANCPGITSIRANSLRTLPPDQASDEEMVAED
ncbi:dynein regulatory complex subunit 6-like [Leucoraja erinacea]|uniref:dynein regulatory complex subunit 6-like n=1 Tax=Leucoraja erinaceus TaxID=7782 RepID=UPI002456CC68|nr:dynein regulatory complex subunit 6-like [Leucoraja erinacea]